MTTPSFHTTATTTQDGDLRMVDADSIEEGTIVEVDGDRHEVMAVRTRASRVHLRLSSGRTKVVSVGTQVPVLW